MAGPYDIFINIWQSNNYSSYRYDPAVDVGHSRIFQMEYNAGSPETPGPVTVVTGEPLSYQGAGTVGVDGPPIGHILAFCRDYYLPNRLQSGRNILIIPNAVGGTGFSNYDFNNTVQVPPAYGWGIVAGVGGILHERTITRVNAAMAANPGSVIKACLCQGGEADGFWRAPKFVNGTPTTYYEDLEQVQMGRGTYESFRDYTVAEVADFRARWTGGADVPFLFGQMSPKYWEGPPYVGTPPGKIGSLLALEDMASFVANSISIPSAGLTTNNTLLNGSDAYAGPNTYVHFDAESQRGSATQTNPLSKRYWEGFQALVPADVWTASPVKIGAGGWTTGGSISDDGVTLCARTDAHGCYVFNDTTGEWDNMVELGKIPDEYAFPGGGGLYEGAMEVAVAPSNSNIIYWAQGVSVIPPVPGVGGVRVFKSTNRGATSVILPDFAPNNQGGGNAGGSRAYGRKMAVDPVNPDIVIIGLQTRFDYASFPTGGGTWLTLDGGATWVEQNSKGLPKPVYVPGDHIECMTGLLFDRASVSGGRCQTIYAFSMGNGLYRTTNGGTSWSLFAGLATLPLVTDMQQSRVDNTIYLTGVTYATNPVMMGWRIVGGVLSALTVYSFLYSGSNIPHPTIAGCVVSLALTGQFQISYDSGTTWQGFDNIAVSAPDAPWMAQTGGYTYLNSYHGLIDCSVGNTRSGKVIVFGGKGVLRSVLNVPTSGMLSSQVQYMTGGIELLCATNITHPPGGKFQLTVQDKRNFTRGDNELNTYPSKHGFARWQISAIEYGQECTWAKSNPSFLVGAAGHDSYDDGYSTDGGETWNAWPTMPPSDVQSNGIGTFTQWRRGCMAAATPNNIIWWPTNRAPPFYTKDGGNTWNYLTINGYTGSHNWEVNDPTLANYPFTEANYTGTRQRHIIDADNVNIGTYLVNIQGNSNAAATAVDGLWLSTNQGDTWTRIGSRAYPFDQHTKLRHVNGVGGAYVYTPGDQGGGLGGGLWKIQVAGGGTGTGAPTITQYPGVIEPKDVAIGKLMPGKAWPRIWFVGWLDPPDTSTDASSPEKFGVYYTDDGDLTDPEWIKVSTSVAPANNLNGIVCIGASPDTADLVLLGYAASGFVQISKEPEPPSHYFRSPYRRGGFRAGLL